MCATARIASHGPSGMVADGEAPGCCGAISTRRACGLVAKRKGGSSLRASPSMPAATGPSERTSNDGADHCCTRFAPSLAAPAPMTVMPSTPASRRGRVPEAIARALRPRLSTGLPFSRKQCREEETLSQATNCGLSLIREMWRRMGKFAIRATHDIICEPTLLRAVARTLCQPAARASSGELS